MSFLKVWASLWIKCNTLIWNKETTTWHQSWCIVYHFSPEDFSLLYESEPNWFIQVCFTVVFLTFNYYNYLFLKMRIWIHKCDLTPKADKTQIVPPSHFCENISFWNYERNPLIWKYILMSIKVTIFSLLRNVFLKMSHLIDFHFFEKKNSHFIS